jgi:hypothetical protein
MAHPRRVHRQAYDGESRARVEVPRARGLSSPPIGPSTLENGSNLNKNVLIAPVLRPLPVTTPSPLRISPVCATASARSRSFPLFNAPVAPRRAPFCRRCLRARTRGFSSLLNLRAWARRSRDLGAGRCPRRSMARATLQCWAQQQASSCLTVDETYQATAA